MRYSDILGESHLRSFEIKLSYSMMGTNSYVIPVEVFTLDSRDEAMKALRENGYLRALYIYPEGKIIWWAVEEAEHHEVAAELNIPHYDRLFLHPHHVSFYNQPDDDDDASESDAELMGILQTNRLLKRIYGEVKVVGED